MSALLRQAWAAYCAGPYSHPPSPIESAGCYLAIWGSPEVAYRQLAHLMPNDPYFAQIRRYLLEAAKEEVAA